MICPDCGTALAPKDFAGVQIDECSKCGGRWFDPGELREAEDNTDEDLSWKTFSLWQDPASFRVGDRKKTCPSCGDLLASMDYGETGVVVNYCPGCRGAWLTRGAFGEIIRALEQELKGMTASDYLKETVREAEELIGASEEVGREWKQFRIVLRLLEYRFLAEHGALARLIENFASPFA